MALTMTHLGVVDVETEVALRVVLTADSPADIRKVGHLFMAAVELSEASAEDE